MKQVTPNLFRGPKINLHGLIGINITSILNLESGSQVIGDDSPLEEAMDAEKFNITFYSHPLGGFFPPSLKELRLAVRAISRTMVRSRPEDRMYVHCRHGKDRTGMVIAAYRILCEGWSPERAAKEAISEGMHWVYLPWLIQLWRL